MKLNEKNENHSTSDFSKKFETEKNNLEAEKFAQNQEQFKQIIQPVEQIDPNFQNPYIWRIGFGRRFGAYIIDYVFLMLLFLIAALTTGVADRIMDFVGNDGGLSMLTNLEKINELTILTNKIILPLMLAVTFIYFSLEIIFAQSLGKMLLGIQIGTADKKIASYSKLLLRFVIKYGDSVLKLIFVLTALSFVETFSTMWNFIIFVGFFFVLSARKQALHDMIVGTAVYFKDELLQLNSNE